MKSFSLQLQSYKKKETLKDIVSFVGTDSSGQFGILANHARMITYLNFGLAKFTYDNKLVEYVAIPGGMLYFNDKILTINTKNYVRNTDYNQIIDILDNELKIETKDTQELKESLHKLDAEMIKHLSNLKHKYEGNFE